jgi:DNA polymerase alpha subunit A
LKYVVTMTLPQICLVRHLSVLPRENCVDQEENGCAYDMDVVPAPRDVYGDFEMIQKQIRIKLRKGRFLKRKYAFEEKDVPQGESHRFKVVCSFNGMHTLPASVRYRELKYFLDIRHVFELPILKRKIVHSVGSTEER